MRREVLDVQSLISSVGDLSKQNVSAFAPPCEINLKGLRLAGLGPPPYVITAVLHPLSDRNIKLRVRSVVANLKADLWV